MGSVLVRIIDWLFVISMAVGPSAAYIPQYFQIRSSRNHKAFSSSICFILLIANISRLCCYILESYAFSLFVQSSLMIFVQLVLLHLIVRLNACDILPSRSKSSSKDEDFSASSSNLIATERSYFAAFWAWQSFMEYILFLAAFTIVFMALISLNLVFDRSFVPNYLFFYFSTGVESTLCMPQLLTNYRNKCTEGLNKTLVFTWIFGDCYKLFFYIHYIDSNSNSRFAFISCAAIQIAVDCLIICQIIHYKRLKNRTERANPELSRPSSTDPLKPEKEAKATPILVFSNKF
jgi:hypothetical protein